MAEQSLQDGEAAKAGVKNADARWVRGRMSHAVTIVDREGLIPPDRYA
jgi:hypothetical protein